MFVKIASLNKIIKSLGLVFGDIGTSPIYTCTAIFLLIQPTYFNVMGIVSLIIWTLLILVTLEYVFLAMSLSRKGEGGTIVLKEILIPFVKSKKKIRVINFLAFIGISLLIGDGVITPAISILSAVEGTRLIPGFEHIPQFIMIAIAGLIAIGLFSFQKKGTEKIAGTFGPIMLIWFIALFTAGLFSVLKVPEIILAINPYYAFKFISHHGIAGFFILSEVILCATGGEALYADMGHLRRKPITQAWYFVFIALAINYLGQGAFMLRYPHATNILFEMIFNEWAL
ncbi:MAG: KUP/HAK/KT family potassium transporter, partial [Candidatus Margulisiibacteriota bacterium]